MLVGAIPKYCEYQSAKVSIVACLCRMTATLVTLVWCWPGLVAGAALILLIYTLLAQGGSQEHKEVGYSSIAK